jgi:thiosulfate/3-mercaptopyruvate sulfurtransferase
MSRTLAWPRILLPFAAIVALAAFFVACGGDDDDGDTGATTAVTESAGTAAAPSATATTEATKAAATDAYANPQLLTEAADLNAKTGDAGTVIVDLRKKEAYDEGHIPGAVWYDSSKLKDPDEKLYVIRDTLFAEYAGEIGIDSAKHVVAYDDGNGLSATRFWWVLWYYGHDDASVLNGGWAKWQKDGLPVSKDAPEVTKVSFQAAVNDEVVCALDYVEEKSGNPDPNVVILDVRSPAEYTGSDVRAAKGGHVPNAVNLDWTRSLTESEPKVWKSAKELAALYSEAGLEPGQEVITYCQTGVRAAHSLFTLRLMGYDSVKNFDGSWQEWGNDKDTAVER